MRVWNRFIVVTSLVLAGVLFSAPTPSLAVTACDVIQKQLDGLRELRKETADELRQPRLKAGEKAAGIK